MLGYYFQPKIQVYIPGLPDMEMEAQHIAWGSPSDFEDSLYRI